MRVTVLGMGIMGIGMAGSLLRDGHDVTVWNRHAERAKPVADQGATVASDLASAVENADVVITMLYDEAAVSEVAAEFMPHMKTDAVWMQSATVGPEGQRRLGDAASAAHVVMIDAPVLGTKKPAEDGKLVVLVSGPKATVESLSPVFASVGSRSVTAGEEIGQASALKLACNAMVATLTAATAQSVAMMQSFGLDPALFLDALDGGPINSPYTQLKGKMMIDGDYTPSFGLDGVIKDLGLMVDAIPADTSQVLVAVRSAFSAASEDGHGSDDMAAVVTAFTATN